MRYLFKHILIGFTALILLAETIKAQSIPIPDQKQDSLAAIFMQSISETKLFYENLDHSGMQSNLLFNYGFLILNDLEDWNNGVPVMTSLYRWKYIYSGINNSVINGTLGLPDISALIDSNTVHEKYASSLVGLSILFYRGDYLPDTVLKDMLNAGDFSNPEYQPLSIFSGTTLLQQVNNGTVYYHFRPELLFSNADSLINELWIDLEDGIGYRFVNKKAEQTFVSVYSSVGEKSIRFKIITDNDTLLSFSKINITALELDAPDFTGYIDGDDSLFTLFNTNKSDPAIGLNSASYAYLEGCDGILDKPVIICEGFDILGDQTLDYMQSKWSNTIDNLNANGYDIFIVNIDNPGNSLFENAKIIKTLIRGINAHKQDYFEAIYIGESMGGIIGRIALKQLENEGYNHQVGLYVSYDSPHKGAFIPEGLQYTLMDLAVSFPILALNSYFTGLLSDLFGGETNAFSLMYTFSSLGARQLMANHIFGSGAYSQFQAELAQLGYPEKTRNIAFSNGSNRALLQSNTSPGAIMFNRQIVLVLYNFFLKAWYTDYEPDNQKVSSVIVYTPGHILPTIINNKISGSYRPYTDAPGGFIHNTIPAIFDHESDIKFTFVPTASAIDLDQSLWNAGNYSFYNENYTARNTQALLENNLTPFDDIYADDDNTFHVNNVDAELELQINEVEFMPYELFIQNKNILNNRDYEASSSIIAGRDVDNQIYYDFPHSYEKHNDEGDVIIESGSIVNFRAVNEIILSDGFTAEEGSVFHAEVGIDMCYPNNRQSVSIPSNTIIQLEQTTCNQFSARINSNSTKINYLWKLTGEKIVTNYSGNEFQIDNLESGQYTLYCEIGSGGSTIDSKIIQVQCSENNALNTPFVKNNEPDIIPQFFVYPNPTNDFVNIIPDQLADIKQYSVTISDLFGKNLTNFTSNGIQKLDLSVFSKGVYFLTIKTQDYEINTKIILY